MINTLDELRAAFNSGAPHMLKDDEYVNLQNLCHMLFDDEAIFRYGEMNIDDKMFDSATYNKRIQLLNNARASTAEQTYDKRVYDLIRNIASDGKIIQPANIAVLDDEFAFIVDFIIWNPYTETIQPIIYIPVDFDFNKTKEIKHRLYPELAYYTHAAMKKIANANHCIVKPMMMVIIDNNGRFAMYDMDRYFLFLDSSNMNYVYRKVRNTIKSKSSTDSDVKEGGICEFE